MCRLLYFLLIDLVCLSLFTAIVGCGDGCSNEHGINKTGALAGLISWRESTDELSGSILSSGDFEKRIKKILSETPKPSQLVESVGIQGSLNISSNAKTVIIEIKIQMKNHATPFETGIAAYGSAGSSKGALALVDKALIDLAFALKNLLKLVGASSKVLIGSLDAAEADEQILALKLLGQNKDKAAVPAIGKLLSDPRDQVKEAASETLAEIGDESAVPLLIEAIKNYDLRSEVRAIEALGRIGGEQAKAYLEMTAEGHDIKEVRALSKSLIENIKNR